MKLNIKNTFTELPADSIKENFTRKVPNACFSYVKPVVPKNPQLIHASKEVTDLLEISENDIANDKFVNIFSGKCIYPNTRPYAMCYGGHQFGNWAGQLGDGRAINLFEIQNKNNLWAVQLKGAGKTPYSRSADGLAVLRSSIREYLCSEAMHHLRVPTTRALSLILSGENVLRDVLYNGNAEFEKGAIVCRVAPSFIRFGNFEILASQKDLETLRKLTNYTIQNFYKDIDINRGADAYIEFFNIVAKKTLQLIIEWQRVGFVHGVMNTDNMSILGLTIDYGPYGWLDNFDPDFTPNTTDNEHKRYRFGNQVNIGLWNLIQLANAIYPLVNDTKPFEKILAEYQKDYVTLHHEMMLNKLGLDYITETTKKTIKDLKVLMKECEIDYTMFFRELIGLDKKNPEQFFDTIKKCSYNSSIDNYKTKWNEWLVQYAQIILDDDDCLRKLKMKQNNPKYILRNYMAQLAIDGANQGDYSIIMELFEMLTNPYSEQPEFQKWYALRPDWAKEKVGCSQLSCSS